MQRQMDPQAPESGFMAVAIEQARAGLSEGGVPIGAVLVIDGEIAGAGRNRRIQTASPVRHAEAEALEAAGFLPDGFKRATIYTTLIPCYMCAGAIIHYGIPRVVSGESRTVPGGEDLLRAHGVEVVDLDLEECRQMMATFIRENPDLWHERVVEEED